MTVKPRRWFQFHLLTLIVLSLSAGGVMWLNRPHTVRYCAKCDEFVDIRRGFPLCVAAAHGMVISLPPDLFKESSGAHCLDGAIKEQVHALVGDGRGQYLGANEWAVFPENYQYHYDVGGAVIDVLCAVLFLAIAAVLSEWIIRRRETHRA